MSVVHADPEDWSYARFLAVLERLPWVMQYTGMRKMSDDERERHNRLTECDGE